MVEQRGRSGSSRTAGVQAQPFLDIRNLVQSGGEQGLLSVAFHPGTRRTTSSTSTTPTRTATRGWSSTARTAPRAIESSARQLFFEKQPFSNHNGGQLAFGPDGLLYIGMGDGGSGGDPNNNGQTFTNKLAKIWKIDVERRRIAQPELVAYGLRNPWRFSFDRATGDLYIGDVGQGAGRRSTTSRGRRLSQAVNFGWAVYEGRAPYDR